MKMKVAIATSENRLNALVDNHFGRCKWFCIYDSKSRMHEFTENSYGQNTEHAGREAAIFLCGTGIQMAVAGRFGAKVVEIFTQKNVQMIIPEKVITIQDIINKLK
jgi:predicted Fe-Mo cluster-binding NifX family protein